MELNLDFTTHQSIGNVNDENYEDNHKSFKRAKALYNNDEELVHNLILESFDNLGIEITEGMEILIPIGDHLDGLISSLKFKVNAVNEKEANLSLTKVFYR